MSNSIVSASLSNHPQAAGMALSMNQFVNPLRKHVICLARKVWISVSVVWVKSAGAPSCKQLDVDEIRQITTAISTMAKSPTRASSKKSSLKFDEKVNHSGSVVGSIDAGARLLKEVFAEDRC